MISPNSIAVVRERSDLASVIGETVKLVRRGRSLLGLCPFHKEKTPSFHVNADTGRFYCFGCHASGNVFDFVMKLEGITFPEAVERMAERAGVIVEYDGSSAEAQQAKDALRAQQGFYEVNAIAAAFFEEQLREPQGRVAREELARRGLKAQTPTDAVADALQAFRVGYAPSSWDALALHLQAQGVTPTLSTALGLVAPRRDGSGHYDFFRNRLMFAVIDMQGRVVGFSGRILPDPQTGEVDKKTGKYVNSPESPIYKKSQVVFGLFQARQAVRQKQQAILVEGNFDVVSLHARGIHHVVAPLGTAFTLTQAKAIRKLSPRVVVMMDGDAAGREAVLKSRAACKEAGLEALVASLPDGADPDDWVRKHGAAGIDAVEAKAKPLVLYLLEQVLDESFPRNRPEQQAERVRKVAEIIAAEDDLTVRALAQNHADQLASRFNLADARTIKALEREIQRRVSTKDPGLAAKPRVVLGEDRLGLEILGCVLDCPDILYNESFQSAISELEGEIARSIALARAVRDEPNATWDESFLAHLPPSIHEFAAQRLASPELGDPGEALTVVLNNARKLKRLVISREHAQVLRDIDKAEVRGDTNEQDALLLEAVRKHQERVGL